MNILVPQGIGDSIWALHKVQALARQHGAGKLDISIGCMGGNPVEERALEVLRRFDFVHMARMYGMPINYGQAGILLKPGPPADENGYYRYLDDGIPEGLPGIDYIMMPNAPMERGIRLEDWLPEYEVNWDLMSHYQSVPEENDQAEALAQRLGPYAVFHFGSLDANTTNGHNRGPLWRPEDWLQLGKELYRRGVEIVMVGAPYDRAYVKQLLMPPPHWVNLVGSLSINQTFAHVRRAKLAITYQSGIGIMASYFGVPTGIFWRPKGDSVSPDYYISFEEAMASAWARPDMIAAGKHLPLIYGKHGAGYILAQIDERGWV